MKTASLLLALTLWGASLSGQGYLDLFKLEYDEGFRRPVENTGEKTRFTELSADLTIPVVRPSGNAFITGLLADRTELTGHTQLLVHGVSLKLGANIRHGNHWSGYYMLMPRFASDGGSPDRDDLQVGLIALFKKQRQPDRHFRVGAYLNTEFFGPLLVPMFGYYRKMDRWELNLLLPISGELTYQSADWLRTGLKFNGFIRSYTLDAETPGYAVKSNNEASAIAYFTKGKLVWYVAGGLTIGRYVRTYDRSDKLDLAMSVLKFGDNRTPLNEDFRDGLFVKTGLFFRIQSE